MAHICQVLADVGFLTLKEGVAFGRPTLITSLCVLRPIASDSSSVKEAT